MKNYVYTLAFAILLGGASCQTSKKPALNHQDSSYGQAPNSRTSASSTNASSGSRKVASKPAFARTEADARQEFEERMKANAKKYEEQAKLAEKPQYSDPSYFGHKKKPKKRPVGKRKLCKECGIVH